MSNSAHNQFDDVHLLHHVAVHSRDESTIRALLYASPKYAKFVQQNRSVRLELYDAAVQKSFNKWGAEKWRAFGCYHRGGNEAAVNRADGRRAWYKEGKRHRDGNKPAVEKADGTRERWENGERL